MHTPIQHLYKPAQDSEDLLYAWFSSMHTRVDCILCAGKSEAELMLVANHIYDALCLLEKTANFYDPTSELAHVNRTAAQGPVVLSRELYTMIDMCLEYHKKTLGCFDVTIHSENYNKETIHAVQLSPAGQSIFFQQAGVSINLSGFLKGYALESIKEILKTHGIENALISMGNSSVLALGNHPAGSGWKINFGNHPNTTTDNKNLSILLQNNCLTTSGNDSDERKHIVSPQSGQLVEGNKQIAVVTENGAIGEILSTGLFAANPEQREVLITTFRPLLLDLFLIGY